MPYQAWNKGLNKSKHAGLVKIASARRKKNNFLKWHKENPVHYEKLERSPDLAELIGVILGDGHIQAFPRTERLIITSNSNNPEFVDRYSKLINKLFNKKPTVLKSRSENSTRISLYQKNISKRMKIPSGSKKNFNFRAPAWILENEKCLLGLLRGLFEAEGSLSVHRPSYTYNLQFSNKNKSLLNVVEKGLSKMGFHPEVRSDVVRIRKKSEVEKFLKIVKFREY